ncbi:MAG: hypothetical protein WC635_15025 [Bacteriovorax sp.]|jgi:hypothetical protein
MKNLLLILAVSTINFTAYSEEPAATGVSNLKNHISGQTTDIGAPVDPAAIPASTEGLNISPDQRAELTKQLQLIKDSQAEADKLMKEMEKD